MENWSKNFIIDKQSYQEKLVSRVIRSTMEVGPAKIRRRTFLKISDVSFNLILSNDIKQEFENFYYRNDCLLFSFIKPDNNKTVNARFIDCPKFSVMETLWTISVELEIFDD